MAAYERFTDRARRVLVTSQQLAAERGHFIDAEHVLEALTGTEGIASRVLQGAGVNAENLAGVIATMHPPVERVAASDALKSLGIDPTEIREQVAQTHGAAAARMAGDEQPPFSVEGKRLLENTIREMAGLGHEHIGTEHLLLAVLDDPASVATRSLGALGLEPENIRTELLRAISG